jgi:putative endonuclease
MAKHNKFGKIGENASRDYLISHGYVVRETNWRLGHLEIDIVAQEPGTDCLHIIEVKTRDNDVDFDPMEAITRAKIRNMVNAANGYIEHYQLHMSVQFDVMIIVGTPQDFEIRFYPDAFDPPLTTR